MVDLTDEYVVEKSVYSDPSMRRALFHVVEALFLYTKSGCGVMSSVSLRCEV